ncbi:transposase [Shewanella sp. GutCb]|uniref:TnsD family Tn7-like transposition protein n=1 Tax=Shewanella sp. GutCb TaxID=2058315 RepID=UPI000C7C4F2C|nr:TnsD family Tn7-like transposition protein [Shewanella sp. GutCb]PKG74692.1 transposase [Shewanella sp. GutCb]
MQLPTALADESLFSRICRHLAICELPLEQALQKLVGDGRGAIHPYLTSNLHITGQFSEESPEVLQSNQTLRPLFSYYLPQYRTILENVTTNTNDILRASQLSTFRGKERLSVKHCALCAKDDVYNFGVAYWHLAHQIPGVEACSVHRTWLVHNELLDRSHASGVLLPDIRVEPIYCNELAREFSKFSLNKIRSLQSKKQSVVTISDTYLKKLSINGGLTQSGRVKRKKIAKELFEISEELFPTQSDLSLRTPEDYRFVSSLLSGQYPQHPFKHLLFEFYLSRSKHDDEPETRIMNVNAPINKEDHCCDLLRSGLSMAAVSREIDKSRCYVKSIALKNNIPVNLKPKKITLNLKNSIIKWARKGFHRDVLAKLHDISTGSVELIISTTAGLVEWRKQCKVESLRRRYCCQIIRFIASNPKACRQEVKSTNEAAFYWLYIHEHQWLESVLPVATQTQHVGRVDWHQRDKLLVAKICLIMQQHQNQLSRTQLDKLLGGHGWLTKKKHKLPRALMKYQSLLKEKR